MHRFFADNDTIGTNSITIHGEDVNHITKVLRLRAGDTIIISDGEKYEYECSIKSQNKKSVVCSIINKREIISEPPLKVHLYQGIPKGTKFDLIIQKCTELGIETIIPVDTERVVVRLRGDNDISNKITRWRRIAEEAAKQSGRGVVPSVSEPLMFKDAIERFKEYDLVIMPYEKENTIGLKQILQARYNINNAAIFIGPEGGFSPGEVCMAEEAGAVAVTLGPRILRTETAGFTCLACLMYEYGDIGGNPYAKSSL